jgi:hypothetical protein
MTTTPVDPYVEALIDGEWIDITEDVRLGSADSGGGIKIVRGRPNEGATAEPTQVNFTLNNGPSKVPSTLGISGCYSPRNPNGPYWKKLGRNLPIRIGLSRRHDPFDRTEVDGWARLPDRVDPELNTVRGARWVSWGAQNRLDVTPGNATIACGVGNTIVTTEEVYGDVSMRARVKVSDRTSEFGFMLRMYNAYPTTADTTFESGVADWVSSGGSLVSTSAQARSGSLSGLLTVSGSPTQAYVRQTATHRTPVNVGATYRLRVWVRSTSTPNHAASIDWLDAAGAYLSTSVSSIVALVANTWTMREFDGVAPLGAAYAVYGPTLTGNPPNGTLLYVDEVELIDYTASSWYSAYIAPGGTDQMRFGKVYPGGSYSYNFNLPTNIVVDTWYWIAAQISGTRLRMKFWKEIDPEPDWYARWNDPDQTAQGSIAQAGTVGFIGKNGSAIYTISEVTIDQWRAHAEITRLPVKWDLSRQDRWVPIQARGMLQRLGQGRKALSSAVTRMLRLYPTSQLWLPLEEPTGTNQASNLAPNSQAAQVRDLTFNAADTVNAAGLAGSVTLGEETSFINATINTHAPTGAETFLFFFRNPANPASDLTLLTLIATNGTAAAWKITLGTAGFVRVDALDRYNTVIATKNTVFYTTEVPVGTWIAVQFYMFQNGGNVDWVMNWHGIGTDFTYTNGPNSFAGTVGLLRNASARSSAAHVAMGGVTFGTWFHAASDLDFVSPEFYEGASAFIREEAAVRAERLAREEGVRLTVTGQALESHPMAAQLPARFLDLLDDCAQAEGGAITEERDDLVLNFVTRDSLYNQVKLPLDIDAGHLSSPLDVVDDDQATRNDVTVSRPDGGFYRSVQTEGPLNVNPPEEDPENGVGIYDEAPEIPLGTDLQLKAAANWRRSVGTQSDPRYTSLHADFAATAYQDDDYQAAAAWSMDVGRVVELINPEVSPDPHEQLIQSYEETIDQYDWDITWVTAPASVYRVGVLEYTTRLDTRYLVVESDFDAGTDTAMTTERTDSTKGLWVLPVDSPESFPFDVMVDGVRLRVTSASGTSDPQTLTVEQLPINGILKTIPAGEPIKVHQAWRLAW